MRVIEIIQESQGGIYRRGQEVEMGGQVQFANKQNQQIQLLGTQVFPEEEIAFDTPQELAQAYTAYLTDLNVDSADIHLSGNANTSKAALVTVWADIANDKHIAYVKLVKAKSGPGKVAPVMWSNSDFSKASGFGAQTKVAQRATLNLKPNKTVETNVQLDASGIANSVASIAQTRDDLDPVLQQGLAQLIENVANGIKDPVPGLAPYHSSIEVDFGEVAAPVSLITGNLATGNGYKLAEKALLTDPYGMHWSDLSVIEYPNAGNESLYDSYIYITDKIKINVSSKDKKGGAAASVAGIVDQIANEPDKYQGVIDQFPDAYNLIKTIASPPPIYWHSKGPDYERDFDPETNAPVAKTRLDKNKKNPTFGQQVQVQGNMGINGPLYLAEHLFNFIDQTEAHMIMNMIEHGVGVHPDQALKTKHITPNLHSLIKIKGAKNYNDPSYSCGWHLLAALAKKVANHVNADKKLKLDSFFKAILERSNMIQVKTAVSKTGPTDTDDVGGAAFNQFTVIYPPIFDGKIELNADTNYMATRAPVSSGLAFKIP
jgi:hypothetical protein